MGYTHYWSLNKPNRKKGEAERVEKIYKQALLECQRVLKAYQKDAADYERLSGFSVHTKLGQYGGLEVNGKGSEAHEDFALREHFRDQLAAGFDFCKTAHKPYDVAVVACLCVLKYRLGSLFNVSSDGDEVDWQAGAELAARVLKRKIGVPTSIERDESITLQIVNGGK